MEYDKNMEYISQTQTLVGQRKRELVDTQTGEIIWVDQITKRTYGTKNFWKCYLMDFLTVLGIIDSRQLGTYKKISKDTGCSSTTIARIMKKLQENNFIKKDQNGAWLVNPNILMKGNDTKRQILLSYYETEEPIDKITLNRTKRPALEENTMKESNDFEATVGELPSEIRESETND